MDCLSIIQQIGDIGKKEQTCPPLRDRLTLDSQNHIEQQSSYPGIQGHGTG
jgi:hypothetical protein